ASGYADEYAAAIRNAGVIYQAYQKDKETDPEGRRALPAFTQMQANELADFVVDPNWPVSMRAAVWNRVTSPQVKQLIYEFVFPVWAVAYYGQSACRGGLVTRDLACSASAKPIDPPLTFTLVTV